MKRSAPRPSRMLACSPKRSRRTRADADSPIGPIEPAMNTSRPEISRASRASLTAAELIRSKSSSRKPAGQLAPVGPEGVRLDQVGAGVDEADVEGDDGLWRTEICLLGRPQPGHGGGDQGAHPAVRDDRRTGLQTCQKSVRHGVKLVKSGGQVRNG